jgi:tetratricopeptide (TPR) repeat protein
MLSSGQASTTTCRTQRSRALAPDALPAQSPGPAAPLWLRWVLPLAIAGITFAAFAPALNNEFLNWDDDKNLLNNDRFRGLGSEQLRWDFTAFFMGHYQPLTWVSYGTDYSIWGIKDPFGYHLTNLLLHALNAVLVYFLAARLLSLVRGLRGPPPLAARVVAAVAALLFAVHPLRVESVAWATERRQVLSVCFLLACVLCYIRYAQGNQGRWRWYAASVALLLVSVLSEAWAMTLPPILLLLDFYPLRRVALTVKSLSTRAGLHVLLDKIPFAAWGGCAAIMAARAQAAAPDTVKTLAEYGIPQRFAQAFYGLAFYVWKTLIPAGLAPLYEIPQHMSPFEPRFILATLLVVSAIVLVLKWRACRPAGPVLLGVYVITLLPVLGFLQSGPQLVADRYSYVSCLPLALLAGAGLWWGADWLSHRWARLPALALSGAVAAVVIGGLAVLTWRQTFVWHDSQTLWKRTAAICPDSPYAHHNLGVELANKQLYDQAIAEFKQAISLNPRHVNALYSLGRALHLEGKTVESIQYFNAALAIKPNEAKAHLWLADALRALGRLGEAARHSELAAQLNPTGGVIPDSSPDAAVARLAAAVQSHPDDANARYQLGMVLGRVGRFPEAAQQLAECVRLQPDHFDALVCLAWTQRQLGNTQAAALDYRQALALRPDSAEAHSRLADLLAEGGQDAAAVSHYRAALHSAPDRWGSLINLAHLLATSQDPAIRNPEEGVRLAEQACQATRFTQPAFLNTLATAYAEAGRFDEAVQTLQRVVPVAAADPNKAVLEDIQRRIQLYQQHRTAP